MDTLLLLALVIGVWALVLIAGPVTRSEPERIEIIVPSQRRSALPGCVLWLVVIAVLFVIVAAQLV